MMLRACNERRAAIRLHVIYHKCAKCMVGKSGWFFERFRAAPDRETEFRKFLRAPMEYSDFCNVASGHMLGGDAGRSGTTSTRL